MKNALIAIFALLFSLVGLAPASADNNLDLPACTIEDGSSGPANCYWDAQERGNGKGKSYSIIGGQILYDTPEDAPAQDAPVKEVVKETVKQVEPADTAKNVLPPCASEDGSYGPNPCHWDGSKQGNGVGKSYTVTGETIAYDAPASLEAQAWELFDAVNAIDLVDTSEAVTVEFIGYNTTGFDAGANQITAWDLDGNHYLFSVSVS